MQPDLFSLVASQASWSVPEIPLRPYQSGALAGVLEAHSRLRGALVCLPTGVGKTRLVGAVCREYVNQGGKCLVLTPTIVLCQQMYEALRALGIRCEIEQADNRVRWPLPPVVVASVATMRGQRLASFPSDTFRMVAADEAHRSVSDQQLAIFGHFTSALRLGVTATPNRVDGLSLANVFDEAVYSMSMLEAISAGWLVPLRFKTAVTDFDAKALRTLAGEVSAGSVEAEITRSGLLHEAANTLAELSAGERSVAFLPTVASSKAFVAELIARGVSAAHVDATTDPVTRIQLFAEFKAGNIRVLSNVGILCEGWDMPEASMIALLNPTKSWSRLTQMIGRCTRLCEGKTHALVIDFCPGRMKKGRLASPADALAGKMLPDAVHELLAKEGDLAQAISDAEHTLEELETKKKQAREAAQRKAEKTAELAALAKKRAFTYGVHDHDAADILGGEGRGSSFYSMGEQEGPTEDERRKEAGLCSIKQSRQLKRFGLNPDMSRHLAGEVMGALGETKWQSLPDRIRNDRRFYAKGAFPGDRASKALNDLRGEP